MAQKDLGMVTAYAYALSQGYTGTEEEFAEGVLASAEYADNAQASATAAAQSKIDAEAAASSVQSSATQIATNTADIADIKTDLDYEINMIRTPTRNIFDSYWESGGLIINDSSHYGEESNTGTYANWYRTGFIAIDASKDYYTLSAKADVGSQYGNIRMFLYDENKAYVGRTGAMYSSYPKTITFTDFPTGRLRTKYIRLVTETKMYQADYQIEVGTTATDYIPPYIIDTTYANVIGAEASKNLNGEWVVGGIDYSTGADSSSTGVRTGYIPVEANKTYAFNIAEFKNAPSVYAFFYDASKSFISRITTAYGYFPKVVTVPDNANIAYVRLNAQTVDIDISEGQAEENIMSTTYRPSTQKTIDESLLPNSVINFKGKRVVVFGDSLTAVGDVESTANQGWTSYFKASAEPSEWHNYAVGGSTWCDYQSGDFMSEQIDTFLEDSVDNVDCFIIFSGTNDTNITVPSNAEIESQFFDANMDVITLANVDKTTWAGAMRYAIGKLTMNYPNAKVLVCTPIHRRYVSSEPVRSLPSTILTKNEIIKKMCLRCGVVCVDTLQSGISPTSNDASLSAYLSDGLHTKPFGAMILARYIISKYMEAFNVE